MFWIHLKCWDENKRFASLLFSLEWHDGVESHNLWGNCIISRMAKI